MEDRTTHIWFPFLPRFPPKPPPTPPTNASSTHRFAQESYSSAVQATTTHGGSPTPRAPFQQNNNQPLWIHIVELILWLIFFGLAAFCFLIIFSMPLPSFVEIDSCYSSFALPPDVTNNQITSNLDVAFSVGKFRLPRSIFYEEMTASVFHGKEILSNITLQPFQLHKNDINSVVEAKFLNITIVFDQWFEQCGVSFVDIGLSGKVTYVQRGWHTVRDVMKVRCKGIVLMVCSPTNHFEPVENHSVEPTFCKSEITTAVDKEINRVLITFPCSFVVYVVAVVVYVNCIKTT